MKTFNIDIHPYLKNVEVTVKNENEFQRKMISGEYGEVEFTTNEKDAQRIKDFAIKYGDDKSSNNGKWWAHCNGYAMDLNVTEAGKKMSINTYRPYGQFGNVKK